MQPVYARVRPGVKGPTVVYDCDVVSSHVAHDVRWRQVLCVRPASVVKTVKVDVYLPGKDVQTIELGWSAETWNTEVYHADGLSPGLASVVSNDGTPLAVYTLLVPGRP